MRFFLLFLFGLFFLASCNGGKKLLREAEIYEQGGLMERAFDSYQSAYQDYNKPEGLVGMKKIAEKNLQLQFAKAQSTCAMGSHLEALQMFEEAFAYQEKFSYLELVSNTGHSLAYQECKTDYINFLTEQAEEALKSENYDLAQSSIERLKRFDPTNKKAEYLDILSRVYPNYKAGVKAMSLGLYRDAYIFFNAVTSLDADFKDALALRNECAEAAKFNMAYIPIHSEKGIKEVEAAVSASIKQEILGLKDPFLQLVERESLDQMLEEQQKSMNAIFNQEEVIEAGKLAGARYIITGELISYEILTAPQRSIEKKGFLGPTAIDKKVKYIENRLGRGLDASFRYQILDAETGKIYASDIVSFSERDNVVWSEFEGDYSRVYPGEWKWQLIGSKEDYVNREEKERLMSEFTGRKGPKSELDLRNQMMKEISNEVAKAVKAFRP